jgi:hypothetical protein
VRVGVGGFVEGLKGAAAGERAGADFERELGGAQGGDWGSGRGRGSGWGRGRERVRGRVQILGVAAVQDPVAEQRLLAAGVVEAVGAADLFEVVALEQIKDLGQRGALGRGDGVDEIRLGGRARDRELDRVREPEEDRTGEDAEDGALAGFGHGGAGEAASIPLIFTSPPQGPPGRSRRERRVALLRRRQARIGRNLPHRRGDHDPYRRHAAASHIV